MTKIIYSNPIRKLIVLVAIYSPILVAALLINHFELHINFLIVFFGVTIPFGLFAGPPLYDIIYQFKIKDLRDYFKYIMDSEKTFSKKEKNRK